jgi:hemerythrin
MEAGGYRLLPAHRQEHQAILAEIQEIRYLFDRAEYDLAAPMALDLLTGLGSHIAASDRRFAEHAPGATASAAATASDPDEGIVLA